MTLNLNQSRTAIIFLTVLLGFQTWLFESIIEGKKKSHQAKSTTAELVFRTFDLPLPLVSSDKQVTLEKFHSKLLLISIFSIQDCFACIYALPSLDLLRRKYNAQGLEVVGIGQAPTKNYLTYLVKANNIDFPVLYDSLFAIKYQNDLQATPIALLLDENRKVIVSGWPGPGEKSRLRFFAKIDSLFNSHQREKKQ